jgi:phosphate uptake regulator
MKRAIRLSVSMHEDIVSYLLGSADRSILEAVIARDNLVDKLYLLALRQLITILRDPYEMGKRGLRYYDAIYMTMFIKSVERVGESFILMDKDMAIEAVRNLEKLKSLEEDIRRRYSEELARKTAVTRILDAISRIVARSVDIAEEVIDIYALKKMDKLKVAESEEEEQLKQQGSVD